MSRAVGPTSTPPRSSARAPARASAPAPARASAPTSAPTRAAAPALTRTLLLALALGLAACSSLYETYDARGTAQGAAAGTYVVRAGDTLYSIAWRHGVDARELARWNALANPDRIYVGQRLRVTPGPAVANRSAAAGRSGSSRAAGSPPGPAAASASASGSASASAPASAASSAAAPAARQASPAASMPRWQWPVSGRIIARYGDPRVLSTGVGIGGQLGVDIRAAAPGRVVYAGSGLPDYGQLVIIEHTDNWLSAYGHNRRVIVNLGQQVGGGEKIAEMGPGPGGEPRLHFEIRRDGDPLDPLTLLPPSG